MQFRGIKINIVIFIIILVIITYFGAKYFYKEYNVNEPLIEELENRKNIEKVQLVNNDNSFLVKIKLSSGVDLKNEFTAIEDISVKHLNEVPKIKIEYKSNSYLDEVYDQIHFALYEGILSGRYTEMQKLVEKELSYYDIKYDLSVDSKRLYIKLEDNKRNLYKVIDFKNEERG